MFCVKEIKEATGAGAGTRREKRKDHERER